MKSHADAQTNDAAARTGEAADTRKAGGLRPALSALRVHQWIKNLLVFVPVLMAHRVLDAPLMLAA
ncbi:MAG: hypothetical protein LC802_11645, partial [Acidobacteria bacterium]|nr:hypothetical protein [Acidobacteriota bacterium]